MKRLAIIVTHPIQYYAPLFKLLQERGNINIMVFYTWGEAAKNAYDPSFRKKIEWDVPLLDGYPYQWVKNEAPKPGSHHFKGIVNPGLFRQIDKWNPTALLVFSWAYDSHLKLLRHYKGKIPVYFRGDSTLIDHHRGLRSVIRRLVLTWVYRYVDHAFYVGLNNLSYFQRHGLKGNQLSFAPHAVDNDRFKQSRSNEVLTLKKRLGISPDDMVVLFAAKLEDKKNPFLLLNAFLNLKLSRTHLIFAGSGPLELPLKKMAMGNKAVHFVGFQNQEAMPVMYQACDLFCLPSKGPGETWGMVINEAMASGKAVLVSDKVGSATDLVSNNNGGIFKSGNMNELENTLKDLLINKNRLHHLGQNSSQIIAGYSLTAIAAVIENQLMKESIHGKGN
jgi:glycosyltransferase involved in cell wall biosynthesis